MKNINISIALGLLTSFFVGCGGGSDANNVELAKTIDLTKDFSSIPEYQRLWYFGALNMGDNRAELGGYSGDGIKVTIMGEEVDASHPELKNRVEKQYNTFAIKDKIVVGEANQPYGFDKIGYGDGHGTHIAGTLAAECDNKGIVGVACGAKIDVYDLGIYGNSEKFIPTGWKHPDDYVTMFITGFASALDDITQKNVSKIVTGSFNIESPYFPLKEGGELDNRSFYDLQQKVENEIENIDDFMTSSLFQFKNISDKENLKKILLTLPDEDKLDTINGILMPKSQEWKMLEESIQRYQQSDGVYIITESNNIFHTTSVLNAMPTISNKVDKDLWISAVLISPKNFDDIKTLQGKKDAIHTSEWENIINDCGEVAQEYCVLIPSYNVISTMTQKVREAEDIFVTIDGYGYQMNTGHSMGAPMIAGALALMQEKNQKENLKLSMKALVRILKESANRSFIGYNAKRHGQGILDVKAALEAMSK